MSVRTGVTSFKDHANSFRRFFRAEQLTEPMRGRARDGNITLQCVITRGTTPAHVARAVVESIAYQVRDVFDAMQEDAGIALRSLLADRGAARNEQLMQFQADILGCAVLRNSSPDVSALGAGFLAGLATGTWSDLNEIAALPREFDPKMTESRRAELHLGWQVAVARARYQRPA